MCPRKKHEITAGDKKSPDMIRHKPKNLLANLPKSLCDIHVFRFPPVFPLDPKVVSSVPNVLSFQELPRFRPCPPRVGRLPPVAKKGPVWSNLRVSRPLFEIRVVNIYLNNIFYHRSKRYRLLPILSFRSF